MKTNSSSLITNKDISYSNKRSSFINMDGIQEYVKNLEFTLAINKEIINDLANENISYRINKEIIEKLNQENLILQMQNSKFVNQQEVLEGKVLILEQLINNYKNHEEELLKEIMLSKKKFMKEIEYKNFAYKNLEMKYKESTSVFKELSNKDIKIRQLVTYIKSKYKIDILKVPTNESSEINKCNKNKAIREYVNSFSSSFNIEKHNEIQEIKEAKEWDPKILYDDTETIDIEAKNTLEKKSFGIYNIGRNTHSIVETFSRNCNMRQNSWIKNEKFMEEILKPEFNPLNYRKN